MLQDAEKADLLPLVLRPEDLEQTCAIIMLDFDQPWEMMNALQRWMSALQETIFQLMPKLPLQLQDRIKSKLTTYVKTYEDPELEGGTRATLANHRASMADGNGGDSSTARDEATAAIDDEEDYSGLKAELPLAEGVLKVNLGIPIIVVCSKVDLLLRGDKSQLLETNLDFIQKHLRSYCLSYAATLVFVETIQSTNVELLYRYILHRVYDSEFTSRPQINEKDQIFIPTGFDSVMLINELCKGAEDALFEERIKKPQG